MSDSVPDDAAPRDVCLECGYDRRGLAEAQPCPECGAAPNPAWTIAWGDMPAEQDNQGRLAYALLVVAVVVVYIGLPLTVVAFLAGGAGTFQGGVVVLLGLAGIAAFNRFGLIRRREREESLPGDAQLRVGVIGFGARLGHGPVRIRPWRKRWRVTTVERANGWQVSIDQYLLGVKLRRVFAFTPSGGKAEADALAAEMAAHVRAAGGAS